MRREDELVVEGWVRGLGLEAFYRRLAEAGRGRGRFRVLVIEVRGRRKVRGGVVGGEWALKKVDGRRGRRVLLGVTTRGAGRLGRRRRLRRETEEFRCVVEEFADVDWTAALDRQLDRLVALRRELEVDFVLEGVVRGAGGGFG